MTVIALTASSGFNQTIDMIHDDHALQDPLLLAALLEGANGGGGARMCFIGWQVCGCGCPSILLGQGKEIRQKECAMA